MVENTTRELLVLISAFAPGEDGAIHAYRLDASSGKLESIGKQSEVENPFFLALSPDSSIRFTNRGRSVVPMMVRSPRLLLTVPAVNRRL